MTSFKQLALVYLFLVCFFSCKKEANPSIEDDVQRKYTNFVAEMNAKGISTGNILVYENEEIIFKSSKGLRSINPIDSLDLNSQFRLASVSKQFTGMSIMKLKEAGKLDYDQKVNTILPEFPYDNITVRQLLHHTSGITDYERLIFENFVIQDSTKQYILGNEDVIKEFYKVNPELDFQPGEKWEYSNTGYLFLASIVEKVSGQHFRDFLKEQIFDPVGMTNTTLYDYQIEEDSDMPNRVYGFRLALNQKDMMSHDYNIVNGVRGDDGIYSTLHDLYKWNMALANYSIISKDYLDEAWSPGITNGGEETGYGFGWGIDKDSIGNLTVKHSGGWVGFGTYLLNEVDSKSGFIALTNNSSDYIREIFSGIDNILHDKTYDLPKKRVYKEMAKLIFEMNVNDAIKHYHKVKADTITYDVSEGDINFLGYGLINENMEDEALEIFKLNIEEYPESANTYDSYADALLIKGDSLKALENYKKCFAMDSTLIYAKDKAEKLAAAIDSN